MPLTEATGTAKVVSPICTNTAWVTASVCGRRRVKRTPWPRTDWMSTEPPSWRTSLRTTSMPTPRPASWLT
ncbi:Uncharacterised protein [Stenotrophomonas maltophilia]|nr:Uncharacterised protein [Stenotrophomonas maltophilia]